MFSGFLFTIIGCFVAIVIVKCLFGGLGRNIANPAIVGRIVLLLSFTTQMTTWPVPRQAQTDATTGVTTADREIAQILRRLQKTVDGKRTPPVLLVVNKADSNNLRANVPEFYELGMGDPYPISAIHGTETGDLLALDTFLIDAQGESTCYFRDSYAYNVEVYDPAAEGEPFAEYKTANFDKTEKKVYYTNDEKRQAASVKLYTDRGIEVAVMNTLIDGNFMSFMEYQGKEEDRVTFARVDADIDGLKEESEEGKDLDAEKLQTLFRGALGKDNLEVKLESLGDADMTAMVTEDEQMRRYKEMSRLYGQNFPIPDSFTLVLNRRNSTVQALAQRDPEDETTKMLCCQVYDLARMAAQPLEAEEITAFLDRSRKLLAMMVNK